MKTLALFVGLAAASPAHTDVSDSGNLTIGGHAAISGSLTLAGSTLTVLGNAFSLGTSTLVVSNGNVGIGTASPGGTLHVRTKASGTTPHVNADEIVAESDGNAGISILTPNSATGAIYFGDPQDATVGQIGYYHTTNDMSFKTNGGTRMNILGDGNVHVVNSMGIATASPGYPLHVIGNAYFSADVSALTFTDRTPYPGTTAEAYAAVLSMQKGPSGGVDHPKLHSFIRAKDVKKYDDILVNGEKVGESKTVFHMVPRVGRDLSATVSAQNEVIKDLLKRIEALEKK